MFACLHTTGTTVAKTGSKFGPMTQPYLTLAIALPPEINQDHLCSPPSPSRGDVTEVRQSDAAGSGGSDPLNTDPGVGRSEPDHRIARP